MRKQRGFCSRFVWLALSGPVLFGVGCNKQETTQQSGSAPATPPPPLPQATVAAPSPADVIVTVNGTQLTRGKLELEVKRLLLARGGANIPPQMRERAVSQMQKRVVDQFVMETVLLAEADRQQVQVEQAAVTAALDRIKGRLPDGVPLEQALANYGTTVAEFEKEVTRELRIRKLLDQKTADLPKPTEAEISAFYEQTPSRFEEPETVHARHILLKCDENAEPSLDARRKAEAQAIRKQLVDGSDFAKLAEQHSDCPSKEKGGDLNTFPRGQMVKAFEEAAFSQEVDAIGPLVRTTFGYHIIQVLAHNQAHKKTLDDVRDQIAKHLDGEKRRDLLESYLAELRKEADITFSDPSQANL